MIMQCLSGFHVYTAIDCNRMMSFPCTQNRMHAVQYCTSGGAD